MLRMITALKNIVLPSGPAARSIRGGLLKGTKMVIDFSSQTQAYLGLQERELDPWFKTLSKTINTAVDVGAADGFYTLYFLCKTNAKKIFAFEPSLHATHPLRTNIELNSSYPIDRVVVSDRFVSDKDSATELRLDSLLPEIVSPCIVKVDTEGAEKRILTGARALLKQPGIHWIVETHSSALEKECKALFEEQGYKTTIVSRAAWRFLLPELRPADHNRWLIATR